MNKPIHISAAGPKNDRQAMWEAIRKHGADSKTFTISDIRGELPGHTLLGKIRDYLSGLAKADYLDCVKPARRGQKSTYTLKKDTGIDAPRVRKDGTHVFQGKAREQMWQTMKIISSFTTKELATHASIEECVIKPNDAQDYIGHLYKAGYLNRITKGVSYSQARYSLLPSMNTGPKPPMVQRIKQVFDLNLGKVMKPEGEEA